MSQNLERINTKGPGEHIQPGLFLWIAGQLQHNKNDLAGDHDQVTRHDAAIRCLATPFAFAWP